MDRSLLSCPRCSRPAQLLVSERTATDGERPFGRRVLRLTCPNACDVPDAHLVRLADPMAC